MSAREVLAIAAASIVVSIAPTLPIVRAQWLGRRHSVSALPLGEVPLFASRASLEPNGFIASGRLVLSATRVTFIPDDAYLEAPLFHGRPYLMCPLAEIRAIAPTGLGPGTYLGGQQRIGLEIRLADGFVARFGVGDVDGWLAAIGDTLAPTNS